VNLITIKGSKELETEVKCLEDEVMILKTAIEEAITKGQKSLALLSDIPESGVVFEEDFALVCADAGPGVVGWVDDF
jgi:type II secretory pathway component HofQ